MVPSPQRERAAAFRDGIVDEVFYALGLGRHGAARRALGRLLHPLAGRIALICAHADEAAAISGISGGSRAILPDFKLRVSARGRERIPERGPLLVVSNHPGGLDSIALLSSMPRADVSVTITDSPLTRAFAGARPHFIFASRDAAGRTAALRASIAQLRRGGALLAFPNGDVEPDPELSPAAAGSFDAWSRSVAVMLRAAPRTQLQVAIASGVLTPRLARSPLVRLRRSPARRQKLAEMLQFLLQAARPRSVELHIRLSFAEPIGAEELLGGADPMAAVAATARRLLAEHVAAHVPDARRAAAAGSGLVPPGPGPVISPQPGPTPR